MKYTNIIFLEALRKSYISLNCFLKKPAGPEVTTKESYKIQRIGSTSFPQSLVYELKLAYTITSPGGKYVMLPQTKIIQNVIKLPPRIIHKLRCKIPKTFSRVRNIYMNYAPLPSGVYSRHEIWSHTKKNISVTYYTIRLKKKFS